MGYKKDQKKRKVTDDDFEVVEMNYNENEATSLWKNIINHILDSFDDIEFDKTNIHGEDKTKFHKGHRINAFWKKTDLEQALEANMASTHLGVKRTAYKVNGCMLEIDTTTNDGTKLLIKNREASLTVHFGRDIWEVGSMIFKSKNYASLKFLEDRKLQYGKLEYGFRPEDGRGESLGFFLSKINKIFSILNLTSEICAAA